MMNLQAIRPQDKIRASLIDVQGVITVGTHNLGRDICIEVESAEAKRMVLDVLKKRLDDDWDVPVFVSIVDMEVRWLEEAKCRDHFSWVREMAFRLPAREKEELFFSLRNALGDVVASEGIPKS